MSYEHIEQIRDRADEKVALFLTAHNMLGLVIGALPPYLLTQQLPFALRALLIIGLGTLGVIATLDVGGLPLYGRLVWRVRGTIRARSEGRRVTPELLQGATATERTLAMPVGGLVMVVGQPASPAVTGTLAQRVRRAGGDERTPAGADRDIPEPSQ
jgi:hypothetical protein